MSVKPGPEGDFWRGVGYGLAATALGGAAVVALVSLVWWLS